MFSKVSKKIVAGTLVMAVAFTSAVVSTPFEASAKAKLNKKSVSITAGDSVTLFSPTKLCAYLQMWDEVKSRVGEKSTK